MKKIEKDFLLLLRNYLHNEYQKVDCHIEDIEILAMTHICIPFVYMGAKNAGLDIPEAWKNYMTVSALRNQQNMQVQTAIIKTLKDAGIPCAVIKGTTVSANYNEPMARTLGDIDILVHVSDYDRTVEILCGDKHENESSEEHQFHYKYTVQGIAVEIHKYVTEYTDDAYGAVTAAFMDKALENIVTKRIDEFEFPSLTNEYQAATLLLHTQRHFFENRLPMRMLCDWAMFVDSVPAEEWEDVVYPFISKMGLGVLSDALTATCIKHLGIKCYDKIKSSVSNKMVECFILEFLNGGVIKDEDSWSQSMGSAYSQNRAKSKGKLTPIIMILNQIARHDFKIAQKSVAFLPFCWILIAIRYLFRRLTGKRDKISFSAFNETAERKEYILKELKLSN